MEVSMRFIGLDVHRDFCEVAIADGGKVRLAGRVQTEPAALALFAQSLAVDDEVALEATGNALGIARIVEPHVGRVVLANPKAVKGITQAGAKTDKIDACTLAKLLAGGFLPAVWLPDEQTRILRRRISARAQLVRQRTRAKNQVHATLIRNLKGKPPVSDLFGARGRRWLAEQDLPADEQETITVCLRQIEFLDGEIALVERALAEQVLSRGEDYAFARPSLTREKIRKLELATGAERQKGKRIGVFATKEQHQLDKQLAAQAELAYRRLVQDWQPAIKGAGAAPGRASRRPSSGQAARQKTAPPPAL